MIAQVQGNSVKSIVAAAVATAAFAIGALPACADTPPTPSQWQEHKGSLDYFALTSFYSCTGIESKVRQLLQYLGARKDVTVNAGACNARDMMIGHSLSVSMRMFTLAPVEGTAPATPAPVMANWTPVTVDQLHPTFMSDGDCELIEQLRGFIKSSFSAQDLDIRANCTPHQVTINSFAVHGSFLKTAAP